MILFPIGTPVRMRLSSTTWAAGVVFDVILDNTMPPQFLLLFHGRNYMELATLNGRVLLSCTDGEIVERDNARIAA